MEATRIARRRRGAERSRRRAPTDRETRERESAARAELFRADETHTSLQGKVNALDALERERVGLAPAAARLLREREQFGEGAVLGPLSDFISADQASALLVERFLGATVHAVLVRDRAVAEAVRAWHATANPGPLLLLPLDALRDALIGRRARRCAVASRRRDRPGRAWVRALLGHAQLGGRRRGVRRRARRGLAAGQHGGPGPLRRRAELFALRAELTATEQARSVGDGSRRRASRRGAGIRAARARGVGRARGGAGRRTARRRAAG